MSEEPPHSEHESFPRGAAGPPQALPAGANVVLLLLSIAVLGGTLALLAWLIFV